MFVDENRAKAELIAMGVIKEALLNELEQTAVIQDALGSHYNLTENTKGKIDIKRDDIKGMTNSRDNLNALLMAIDTEMNGDIVDHRPGMGSRSGLAPVQGPIQETRGDKRLRMALTDMLSDQAISELAKPGLRAGAMTGMSKEERLARAVPYATKINNGYDHRTGSLLTTGLDGGHIFPHNEYPELSAAAFNIAPENKYVNRAKGSREGAALIKSLTNSLKKKFGPASKAGPVPYAQMVNLWNVGRGF